MEKVHNVDTYIMNHSQWIDSLEALREIILSTELDETIKWGGPAYTLEGKNILGIGAFKKHLALWFFQGALLKDQNKKLINAQEGKTKALRQWRFEKLEDIIKEKALIKKYIDEAIINQKNGKSISPSKNKPLTIAPHLLAILESDHLLHEKFNQFTLSKKREFSDYIAEAKREDTKTKRLEKIKVLILNGIGLNDQYRK